MSRKMKHHTEEKKGMESQENNQEPENMTSKEGSSPETEKMSEELPVVEAQDQQPSDQANGQPASQEPDANVLIAQWQDKYLRLSADFDNFRKRYRKEMDDLRKTAGEEMLVAILPVVDDFDRALKSIESAQDLEAVKAGISLINGKFRDFLTQRGVKEIDALHQPFNLDLHEAITKIPAPEEGLIGKNVDVITKGYTLQDKVIRYAKVVVGE